MEYQLVKNIIIFFNDMTFSELSDLLGIAGFAITIIGFGITIFKISSAKKEIASGIAKSNAISEISIAISKIDEIKRLQRAKAWAVLPERYSELRRTVVFLRSLDVSFDESQKAMLQNSVSHFSNIERKIEISANGVTDKELLRINQILSDQSDMFNQVLVEMKMREK